MTDTPLHVQVIELIERRVSARRDEHREKAGNGLPDQDYQRMVGRIRECTAILEELAELKKQSVDSLEDEEETERERHSAHRRKSRARST